LRLDFFRATVAAEKQPAPCALVIHGGGWDSGDRTQFADFNRELAQLGCAVAAIDYRLAPRWRWPAPREDVHAALAFLRMRAVELGIDPTRVVLLGRSAGGQIALATAYDRPDPAIRGVIAFYAPADLEFAWRYAKPSDVLDSFRLLDQYLGGPPEYDLALYRSASAYAQVEARTLPTLLLHGGPDALVWHRQSTRLAERLRAVQVPHLLVDLPWATHAFDYVRTGPGGQLSAFAVTWFVRATTR
jgi:acetyl esterase/lipase